MWSSLLCILSSVGLTPFGQSRFLNKFFLIWKEIFWISYHLFLISEVSLKYFSKWVCSPQPSLPFWEQTCRGTCKSFIKQFLVFLFHPRKFYQTNFQYFFPTCERFQAGLSPSSHCKCTHSQAPTDASKNLQQSKYMCQSSFLHIINCLGSLLCSVFKLSKAHSSSSHSCNFISHLFRHPLS